MLIFISGLVALGLIIGIALILWAVRQRNQQEGQQQPPAQPPQHVQQEVVEGEGVINIAPQQPPQQPQQQQLEQRRGNTFWVFLGIIGGLFLIGLIGCIYFFTSSRFSEVRADVAQVGSEVRQQSTKLADLGTKVDRIEAKTDKVWDKAVEIRQNQTENYRLLAGKIDRTWRTVERIEEKTPPYEISEKNIQRAVDESMAKWAVQYQRGEAK